MAEEVLRSLYRIVVPLPGSPLKEINSYVITAPDRNLVIDTGMNRPECMAAMEAGLAEIGIDLDSTDFLATHLHADHHGLIPSLLRPGRRAFMGAIDAGHMRHGLGWTTDSPMGRYMTRSGFPQDDLIASFQNHPGFKFKPDRVVDYEPLYEGRPGRDRRVPPARDRHSGPHRAATSLSTTPTSDCSSPATTCWATSRPTSRPGRTTTTRWPTTSTAWRRSKALDVELCLPGHRRLIHQFKKRTRELAEHHHERAAEIVDVLNEGGPRNAYDTAARMTWDIVARSWEEFPIMQRWFATGEAIAHLRFLEEQGRVTRADDGDLIVYAAASAA